MAGILRTDTIQNSNTSTIITQTNSTTITIGTTGQTVALASGASQSGFGRAGSVNWDTTPKTTGFTAVSGNGYFCDTTSAAFTVTLPATPTAGDIVSIADYNGVAATNNITVGRNSSNINGSASNLIISKNYAAISFVYVDATAGWRSVDTSDAGNVTNTFVAATGGTITTCGDYKIHSFTGPGTFTVTNTGVGSSTVDYLVVAGGGGGGGTVLGGGGGGGGYRSGICFPISTTSYPITVGSGGTGKITDTTPGGQAPSGTNSVFSTITSAGGGGGGGTCGGGPNGSPGANGGSGGGGSGPTNQPSNMAGGTGNTPPVSPSQGNNGGNALVIAAGGGGGAGAVGGAGVSPGGPGGAGGAGRDASPIFGAAPKGFYPAVPAPRGPASTFAGGGGGGSDGSAASQPGGIGGGGSAGGSPNTAAVTGFTNTGGGGGGGSGGPGGPNGQKGANGGSGIVLIKYKFQ
jgi:hypothetical protein